MINPGMLLSERYEIIDKVGSGGMADVYSGKDLRLNRNVAIKILKQEYSSDAKFVAKFRGEAQSVAGLSHPNIVNVYDVGEDDNFHYIVMELVEGITLKRFIEKKGKLDLNEAIGIGIQIAQGIDEAHKNHIIHRDIKPQNIIISKEGKVKVTDFGIAKAATSNTITSNAMGSVHYISPEQARGGYSDEKSDLYSLGVTIYEMLSGKVPFQGESTVSVAFAHVHEEAPVLNEVDPSIPRSLSRIVQKCMKKKPDMRYKNAEALIMDLRRAISEPDGDYVVMEDDGIEDSPTIRFTDDMVRAVKDSPRKVDSKPSAVEEEPLEAEELDEDALDPKLERILKICSGIVAVIIVVILIVVLMWFFGIFGNKKNSDVDNTSQSAVSASPDVGEFIEVPDIVGHTLEEAESLLDDCNLKYQLLPQESEEEPNKVIEQEPAAGEKVEEYSIIKIYYSQEAGNVTVPSVKNMSDTEAMTALEDAGLTVASTKKVYDDSVKKGLVCGTDPVEGTSVEKGTSVVILISKGPESDMATMPNIVGKKQEVALEKLADAGLEEGTVTYDYSDTYAKGRVITQSIKAGKTVEVGTRVDYTVSLGPKESEPTPTPIEEDATYQGTVVFSNPFDVDEEDAKITVYLEQDGTTTQIYRATNNYDDFPGVFPVTTKSGTKGTVTLYKGKVAVETKKISFKKVS